MSLPSVAIVGRPNVGKSSLLNALVGERVSIVHDRPGVTRDRVAAEIEHGGRRFEVVDMGGIGAADEPGLEADVELQIQAGLAGADVLLFTVDVRAGCLPRDEELARALRQTGKPALVVVNKVDGERQELLVHDFARLGLGVPRAVSAVEGFGLRDLMEAVVGLLPAPRPEEAEARDGGTRIAVVGQRNAGKSSLVNALAGETRVIVSELPGTTRDAVDVKVQRGARTFTLVDTAGMRKRSRLADSVEFYSQQRALRAVQRAHVVIHVVDACREISQVDKKLADAVLRAFKPCILAINKWDLAEGVEPEAYLRYLGDRLPLLHFAPVLFVSAARGDRLAELLDTAFDLHEQARRRVPTAEVNRLIAEAAQVRGPRVGRGQDPKILFATQVRTDPPWIVLFVNDPELFSDDFRRFLENRLRAALPFPEIPIRISFRERRPVRQGD
jgi:GTP-binding protein